METPSSFAGPRKRHRARKSPVRLQISVRDRKGLFPEENVKEVTKGYEVVEVDELLFHRKRRELRAASLKELPKGDPGIAAPPASIEVDPVEVDQAEQAVITETLQPALAAPAGAQPCAVPEPPAEAHTELCKGAASKHWPEQGLDESDAERSAKAMLALVPSATTEREKLLSLCHLFEMRALDALQSAEFSEPTTPAASLHSLLQQFTKRIDEALQDSMIVCQEVQHFSKRAEEQSNRVTKIRAQIDAYAQEKAEWLAVLDEVKCLTEQLVENKDVALLPPVDSQAMEIQSNLQVTQGTAHRKLTFQVEGLCSMTTNIEELVCKAELQRSAMQAEYHREKFKVFPHVNSPARLIRELTTTKRVQIS